MNNTFGMQLVVCIQSFLFEVSYKNYKRTEFYKKGTTYSCVKTIDWDRNLAFIKWSMYNEKGDKGLCVIPKEQFEKNFIDLDKSIIEINNIFEKIMSYD